MNATMNITTLRDVSRVLKWAQIGVTPSQANAQAAHRVVKAFEQGELSDVADVSQASKVLGFIAMGVSPSEDKCKQALAQIERAAQAEAEADSSAERYGRWRN
jgi:cell division GTPase FtsZ